MLLPVLALALMQADNLETGTDLYRQCRATLRMLDDKNPDVADYPHSQSCLQYMHGVTDMMALTGLNVFCFPKNSSYGTAVRVYVQYMEKHPKTMDDYEVIGMVLALKEAYPCSTKKK